jgi:hypothetical protein
MDPYLYFALYSAQDIPERFLPPQEHNFLPRPGKRVVEWRPQWVFKHHLPVIQELGYIPKRIIQEITHYHPALQGPRHILEAAGIETPVILAQWEPTQEELSPLLDAMHTHTHQLLAKEKQQA